MSLICHCDLCFKEYVDGHGMGLDDNNVICEHCYVDYGEEVKEMTLDEFKRISA